jgi:hypothetical protein
MFTIIRKFRLTRGSAVEVSRRVQEGFADAIAHRKHLSRAALLTVWIKRWSQAGGGVSATAPKHARKASTGCARPKPA